MSSRMETSCISGSMSRSFRALAAAVLFLAACAATGPRLAPPKIAVTAVRVDRLEGPQALFGITLDVQNPNPGDIDIEALDAALTLEDERVAGASLVAPVRLPANGAATVELSARVGVDALLRAAAASMRRGPATSAAGAPTLRYSIEGVAAFAGGARVPFGRSGEIGVDGSAATRR
jgi:LEA14-like dessication related protein